jgi:neutral ceramidase
MKIKIKSLLIVFLAVFIIGNSLKCLGQKNKSASIKVGAAKVDITPSADRLPSNYQGILDHIYSRSIVIDNGISSAALVSIDIGMISDQIWMNLSKRIENELEIPLKNIMITATHTHSVPWVMEEGFEDKVFNSVKMAKENLQPASIAFGTGVSYINVNRNIIDPKTGQWWEGPNYDGPSDKTVAVVKFEALNGDPIAVYYNYAMHAVTVGQLDLVSGDAPGATSRYIEDSYDDRMVALWSTGACGDQNPLYFQQTYDLREIRIKDYAKRGEDISNAMPPGGQGLNKKDPVVMKLMGQQKQMILSMGQFLGEEVMHVMRTVDRRETNASIYGDQKMISFPGRKRTNTGRAGFAGTYEDGDSVKIRLGLLLIDDIAFTSVNGEVFNLIAQRLKKESPYARTIVTTLTNGSANSGYIPNDAAFGYYTFEVLSSRLKQGYAENGIVNGILDMMQKAKSPLSH